MSKDLFFLGGFGAPVFLFTPWFAVLKLFGYRVHVVPNSFLTLDPVSVFADRFVEISGQGVDKFDVIGVSYGGNAALYAACLSEELCARVDKMVLVCAPLLGAPALVEPLERLMPGSLSKAIKEMNENSSVIDRMKDPQFHKKIAFDLHCIYHERDIMAPLEKATLPGVGTNHKLEFKWSCVPGLIMHQAASINPETMKTIIRILKE